MNAVMVEDTVAAKPAHRSGAASTSMRVSVATRDMLAGQAKARGLTLTEYMDQVAYRLWRQEALEELRQERLAASQDPEFMAEMADWNDADDDPLMDDEWPEYNNG